jgi:hypothetical protein
VCVVAKPKRRVAKRVTKAAKRKRLTAAKRPKRAEVKRAAPAPRRSAPKPAAASVWASRPEEAQERGDVLIRFARYMTLAQKRIVCDPTMPIAFTRQIATGLELAVPLLQTMN